MLLDEHRKCSACGKAASAKCGGCNVHVYCNKKCQKRDWVAHKTTCKDLQLEKIIERAANLLKELYLDFRENTFDNIVLGAKKVPSANKSEPGKIIIHDVDRRQSKDWFQPFPNDLVDRELKNAVLSAWMCNEPWAFMKSTIAQIFRGCQLRINELAVELGSPPYKTVVITDGRSDQTNWPVLHSVLSLTSLNTGRQWILDLSGDQFGVSQACWRHESYQKRFNAKTVFTYKFGTNEDLLHLHSKIEGVPKMLYGVGLEVASHFNEEIKRWEKSNDIKLHDLVKLQEGEYAEKRINLLETMKKFIAEYVAASDVSEKYKACLEYEGKYPGKSQFESRMSLHNFKATRISTGHQ